MNSEKYGFDGGDCKRDDANVAKCIDIKCCNDEKAWATETCVKRACDCTKQEGSMLCSEKFCCPTTTPETTTNGTTTTPETTTKTSAGVSCLSSLGIAVFIEIMIITLQI